MLYLYMIIFMSNPWVGEGGGMNLLTIFRLLIKVFILRDKRDGAAVKIFLNLFFKIQIKGLEDPFSLF